MENKICNHCGADLTFRAEGECCSKCLNYDEEWDNQQDKGQEKLGLSLDNRIPLARLFKKQKSEVFKGDIK